MPTAISCKNCSHFKSSLFSSLCSEEVECIDDAKSCTTYKKGQVLFHEGTRPLGVFCIHQGKIKLYKQGYDGKEQIVSIARESDIIGYKAMLGDSTYWLTAETLEQCKICFIPKADFLETFMQNENLRQSLLKSVCQEQGSLAEKLLQLSQMSVRERFAATLLVLKDIYGEQEEGDVEINLTREDLANMVGTATETLIRLLHDFKEEKLVSANGRKIIIHEKKPLIKAARLHFAYN
jgi:CRP/FNR family transcriptional regulator